MDVKFCSLLKQYKEKKPLCKTLREEKRLDLFFFKKVEELEFFETSEEDFYFKDEEC